jgi:hypothetical protein
MVRVPTQDLSSWAKLGRSFGAHECSKRFSYIEWTLRMTENFGADLLRLAMTTALF